MISKRRKISPGNSRNAYCIWSCGLNHIPPRNPWQAISISTDTIQNATYTFHLCLYFHGFSLIYFITRSTLPCRWMLYLLPKGAKLFKGPEHPLIYHFLSDWETSNTPDSLWASQQESPHSRLVPPWQGLSGLCIHLQPLCCYLSDLLPPLHLTRRKYLQRNIGRNKGRVILCFSGFILWVADPSVTERLQNKVRFSCCLWGECGHSPKVRDIHRTPGNAWPAVQ